MNVQSTIKAGAGWGIDPNGWACGPAAHLRAAGIIPHSNERCTDEDQHAAPRRRRRAHRRQRLSLRPAEGS